MNRYWLLGLMLGLNACSTLSPETGPLPQLQSQRDSLPDLGPAPELTNSIWLNSDSPLRLADLRGRVVGIDMWTFG